MFKLNGYEFTRKDTKFSLMCGDTAVLEMREEAFVAGRADPTAVEKVEFDVIKRWGEAALINVTITCSWDVVANVYVKGKERLFVSSMIHPRLWKVVDRFWRWYQDRKYADYYADMEREDRVAAFVLAFASDDVNNAIADPREVEGYNVDAD